ncbi:hypothetical protein J40TS1_01040 [Paenibacillus montaniterrae]|uniref:Periplasmic protein n=1 Tax=Paenibacillus montaniterrae TaxID=429341 RepID=A0A919YHI1_9BACL|nr:hypothetical protein [Paenibacillus montaniterrae]GIP14462.1 hypothetical protein J40TS1_01040 [Paenibacillus montaniterrae]
MKEKRTRRWNTYEAFYVELGNYKVADIHITKHALERWKERVSQEQASYSSIASFLWDRLKQEAVQLYYRAEDDLYIVDEDLVFVAQFEQSQKDRNLLGEPLDRMTVITFLGRLSEVVELQDIKRYYAWLRHTRRMNLKKNARTTK